MFSVPKHTEVKREGGFSVPDEGRYDVTLTKIEASRSRKGDPMMVFTETIDNGPEAGHELREYFVFFDYDGNDEEHPTWQRLANIMDAAGYQWSEASSLEAFCAQFPLNRLRWSVDVKHSYKIVGFYDTPNAKEASRQTTEKTEETPYERTQYVDKSIWEQWEGEKAGPYAGVRGGYDYDVIYQKASQKAELKFEAEPEYAIAGGDGETLTPDDDLPF